MGGQERGRLGRVQEMLGSVVALTRDWPAAVGRPAQGDRTRTAGQTVEGLVRVTESDWRGRTWLSDACSGRDGMVASGRVVLSAAISETQGAQGPEWAQARATLSGVVADRGAQGSPGRPRNLPAGRNFAGFRLQPCGLLNGFILRSTCAHCKVGPVRSRYASPALAAGLARGWPGRAGVHLCQAR